MTTQIKIVAIGEFTQALAIELGKEGCLVFVQRSSFHIARAAFIASRSRPIIMAEKASVCALCAM